MDARASRSLSLLISGSFYLQGLVLDGNVGILGVERRGVPGKKGRSSCPSQRHRAQGAGPSPCTLGQSCVRHPHQEEMSTPVLASEQEEAVEERRVAVMGQMT